MALPDLRVAKEWATPGGAMAAFDPKLRRYARTDRRGTVQVMRVGDGAEICRMPGYSPDQLYYWFSPNGEYLAIDDPIQKLLHVWQLAGNVPTRVLNKHTLGGWPKFSPDSREIAVQMDDGRFGFFNLATKEEARRLPPMPPMPPGTSIAFKPDGTQIAFTGPAGTQVHDVVSGKLLWHNERVGDWPEWHPDGKTLATYSYKSDAIDLWDAKSGNMVGNLEGIIGGGVTFAFNPTGSLLVSRGWSGIVRLWDPRSLPADFQRSESRELVSVQPRWKVPGFHG